ncbi:MAG: hypothetical protein JJT81_12730 [Rubellimicrobium sp.]|nr:hypothetical protein [Rubellimicrobium sp.]
MPRIVIFLLILALCGALDIGLHMAGGDLMPMPSEFTPLVDRFGFGSVVSVWIALAFTGMGLVFLFWARRMAGSGRTKGLRYGLALGLMILVAMFEGVGLLGTPLIGELAMGLADAVPIALLIVLLGWTLADDSPNTDAPGRLVVLPVLVVHALAFGFGRTGVQLLGLIESGLAERLLPSLIWPFAMGVTVGVLHLAVTDALKGLSRVAAALTFGVGIFGANWVLFMTFVPMVFPDALADTVLRVGLDMLFVTCGAMMVELQRRNASV